MTKKQLKRQLVTMRAEVVAMDRRVRELEQLVIGVAFQRAYTPPMTDSDDEVFLVVDGGEG